LVSFITTLLINKEKEKYYSPPPTTDTNEYAIHFLKIHQDFPSLLLIKSSDSSLGYDDAATTALVKTQTTTTQEPLSLSLRYVFSTCF
jgi:hypothetical protein